MRQGSRAALTRHFGRRSIRLTRANMPCFGQYDSRMAFVERRSEFGDVTRPVPCPFEVAGDCPCVHQPEVRTDADDANQRSGAVDREVASDEHTLSADGGGVQRIGWPAVARPSSRWRTTCPPLWWPLAGANRRRPTAGEVFDSGDSHTDDSAPAPSRADHFNSDDQRPACWLQRKWGRDVCTDAVAWSPDSGWRIGIGSANRDLDGVRLGVHRRHLRRQRQGVLHSTRLLARA